MSSYHSLKQAIIKLSGKDRIRYLHGRVTNNIKALKQGEAQESLVLTPQGRIQGKFIVGHFSDFLLLISDPLQNKEQEEDFISAILQFKVADDVVVENLSDTHSCFKVFGEKTISYFENLQIENSLKINLPFGRANCLNYILAKEQTPLLDLGKVEALSESEFQLLRIKEAVPLMHQDISEKILGPEIDIEKYASFNKGCYAGQEVVEMSTARGRPNKKLVLLKAAKNEKLLRGSEIFPDKETSKACGNISSLAAEEKATYYLAFIKADILEQKDFVAETLSLEICG